MEKPTKKMDLKATPIAMKRCNNKNLPSSREIHSENCCSCKTARCRSKRCPCFKAHKSCSNCSSTCCRNQTNLPPETPSINIGKGRDVPNSPVDKPATKPVVTNTQHTNNTPAVETVKTDAANKPPRTFHFDSTENSYVNVANSEFIENLDEVQRSNLRKVDGLFEEAFSAKIQFNTAEHLTGGVVDDPFWQETLRRLVSLPNQLWNLPKNRLGREIIQQLSQLMDDIMERKCNSEFLAFILMMLQKNSGRHTSNESKRIIKNRLQAWNEGKFKMLAETTEANMRAHLKTRRGDTTPEQCQRVYNAKVMRGDIHGAVRFITDRETGGVRGLNDEVDGKDVIEILRDKHPNTRVPDPNSWKKYPNLPELPQVHITEDTVRSVASKMRGGAGLGGLDSWFLKHILIGFGHTSSVLRQSVAKFTRWMANDDVPFEAICGFRMGRLIALDKQPGVRPIGIGEIWMRLFSKVVLAETVEEAKNPVE